MNKNKIIGKTLIFIIILIYIITFKNIFGEANGIVGVTVITAVLILLKRDLTTEPLKNFIILLGINIMTGVFSYISANNIWLGIPLNLIVLFTIGYLFSSNIRNLVIIPFGLQYIFMLFEPVYGVDFARRIFALVFGAFFIMAIQFITNKKKLKKTFNESILNIIDSLVEIISLPEYFLEPSAYVMDKLTDTLKDDKEMGSAALKNIDKLKKIIYNKRKKGFYLNKGIKEVVDIIWILEKITLNLDRKCIYKNEKFNEYLKSYLLEIKFCIENKKKIINHKQFYGKLDYDMLDIKKNIDDLVININQLMKIENVKKHDFHIEIPKNFSKLKIIKKDFEIDFLRISYALKLGILGTLAIFVTEFFDFQQGKWLIVTIFALIQPYKELIKLKTKNKIKETIIEVILAAIVFFLFKNTEVRILSVVLVAYLNPYAKRYRNVVICVIFSAIASIIITGDMNIVIGIERVIFVAIGMTIVILVTKYIMPYNVKNMNQYVIKNYNKLRFQLKKDINTSQVEDGVKLLYVLPTFFEEKLISLNNGEKLNELKEFAREQRLIINNLYEKYYNKIKTVG